MLLVRADVEGAGALLVERAAPEVAVDAGAAQVGARRDEREHVDRVEHAIPRILGVARHGAKATGTVSASKAWMQKRSVMPAR